MKMSQLTTTGNVTNATLSRDAKYVSYITEEAGKYSVWLRQTVTPGAIQIVPPTETPYIDAVFSPDASNIYYVRLVAGETVGELYKVPALGGNSQKVISEAFSLSRRRVVAHQQRLERLQRNRACGR
jgi:hypothetical protein